MDFLFFQHILSCICCLWLYIIPLADKLRVQQQRRGAVLFIVVVVRIKGLADTWLTPTAKSQLR